MLIMKFNDYKEDMKNKNNSIFLFNNPLNFNININHPLINPFYRRYKEWKGLSIKFPISNKERFEFENYLIHSKEFKTILKQIGKTTPPLMKK